MILLDLDGAPFVTKIGDIAESLHELCFRDRTYQGGRRFFHESGYFKHRVLAAFDLREI